ncbi:MAG: SRPBCC domain-containing protein [Deltaproteobacteria bacterium]|nr:SRPBCC domain-containing protein [Deltaproteobacteria bacterium]
MATSELARVVVERILPATPAEVFSAWLDRDTLCEFIGPGDASTVDVEIDPRVGGRFVVKMRIEGRSIDHVGEYRVIDPPRRLAFTWQSPATDNRPTLVTIELTPHEDGTRLVLIHEQLPSEEAARRHEKGWTVRVDKLAARFAAAQDH